MHATIIRKRSGSGGENGVLCGPGCPSSYHRTLEILVGGEIKGIPFSLSHPPPLTTDSSLGPRLLPGDPTSCANGGAFWNV